MAQQPSPQNRDAAQHMLGNSVAVYLDGEPTAAAVASSNVDVTGPFPILKRAGAISAERPRTVIPDLRDGSRPGLVREQGAHPACGSHPFGGRRERNRLVGDSVTVHGEQHAGSAPTSGNCSYQGDGTRRALRLRLEAAASARLGVPDARQSPALGRRTRAWCGGPPRCSTQCLDVACGHG